MKRWSIVRILLASIGAGILTTATAEAQAVTGEITGRVLDQAGLGVPGAIVTATNQETALVRSATTGAEGDYTVTQLPPGRYTVSAELTGFKKAEARDIDHRRHAADAAFALAVGPSARSSTSRQQRRWLATRSDVAGIVTSREIGSLPMLNRTLPDSRSSCLRPPVGNFDPTKTRIGNFARGERRRPAARRQRRRRRQQGQRRRQRSRTSPTSRSRNSRVQHRWTAESGRSVGGVVNVISKSGTNQLRGSLFGSYRGDKTRTMDFFERQRKDADPRSQRPSSCARSSVDRLAGRSSATACSSSAPRDSGSARTTCSRRPRSTS